MKATRESDVEKYLVKIAKSYGAEVRKVKWVGRDGAPDRVVMLPPLPAGSVRTEEILGLEVAWRRLTDRSPTIWVELKAPGGKATFPKNAHERKQAREHERMRRMGQRVEVIDSFADVDLIFL